MAAFVPLGGTVIEENAETRAGLTWMVAALSSGGGGTFLFLFWGRWAVGGQSTDMERPSANYPRGIPGGRPCLNLCWLGSKELDQAIFSPVLSQLWHFTLHVFCELKQAMVPRS